MEIVDRLAFNMACQDTKWWCKKGSARKIETILVVLVYCIISLPIKYKPELKMTPQIMDSILVGVTFTVEKHCLHV